MAAVEILSLSPSTFYQSKIQTFLGDARLKSKEASLAHIDIREVSSDSSGDHDDSNEFDVDCLPSQAWLLEQSRHSTVTHAAVRLDLPLALLTDYDRLYHSWNILAAHNHVLRTVFVKNIDATGNVNFKQRIRPGPGPITLGFFDNANASVGLDEPASLAVDWYRDIPEVYLLIQSALIDRTSIVHLWKDFVSILTGGTPRARVPFPDYTSSLNQRDPNAARKFWSDSLKDVPTMALHSLPITRQSTRTTTIVAAPAGITNGTIRKYVKDHGVSRESLLYTAFGLVLNRHCQGGTDVAIFAVEGRDMTVEAAETVVGFADQQYPLKLHLSPEVPIAQSLHNTSQAVALYSSNAFVGYDAIASEHQAAKCDFKIMVSEQHDLLPENVDNDDFTAVIHFVAADTISLVARHDSCILNQKMEVLLDHLMTAITNIMQSSSATLEEISIISNCEKALIHKMGSAITEPAPDNVQKLFEAQVERTPDAPAAQFETDAPISYADLNKLSNRVARQLPAGRGSYVPVCVQRSLNLVVALLSILKSGAAYVTLDPETPQDRNTFIVNDVSADFVVVDKSTVGRFPNEIVIEDIIQSSRYAKDTNLTRTYDPSDPVYVIYTSGSTGKPKGVLHLHSSATSGLAAFPTLPDLRQLLFHNPVFSAAQRSLWSTLKQGGCLCLASKDNLTLHISTTINKMQINVIDVTPSTALLIKPGSVPCLRRMTVAGELINPALIPMWADRLELLNAYGLSENTQVNWRREMVLGQNPQNIGRPTDTTSSFVLVPGTTELSPLLVPGELCLGGGQLALYYINRPEKTAEAFIDNPFGPGRLYRTGDMVVAHEDGSIEMLGRIDFQVKINGQRVEPGDSNSVIQTHPDVYTSSVVSAAIDGRQVLVAVVIPKKNVGWSQLRSELRDLLRQHIPGYMMPSYWVPETELPLNINGKVDVPNLSKYVQSLGKEYLLEFSTASKSAGHINGTWTPMARQMRRIWAEVLNIPIDRISRDDYFQELGGSSLDAIRVVSQTHECGLDVAVADILHIPLGDVVGRRKSDGQSALLAPFSLAPESAKSKLDDLEDAFPATPLQEAFLADSLLGGSTYIYRRYYKINGRSAQEIQTALQMMGSFHPTLRTSFLQHKTSFLQIIRKKVELTWEILDITAQEFSRRRKHHMELGQNFVHFSLLRGSVLAVSMHHALFDYWSNDFWIDDLEAVLSNKPLLNRPSLANFVQHSQEQDSGELESFWRSRLDGAVPSLLGHQSAEHTVVKRDIPVDLHSFGLLHKISPSSLIYAAWASVLALHTAQDKVIFGITLSGRDAAVSGILDMPGPTINTVPFRVQVNAESTALEFAKSIQQDLWKHSIPALLGLRGILRASGTKAGLYDTLVNVLNKDSRNNSANRVLVPCPLQEPNYMDCTMLEAELSATDMQLRLLSSLPETKASLILGNVVETLKAFVIHPENLISGINPTSAEEEAFVDSFSKEHPTTEGLLAHTLMERMATIFPDKLALRSLSGTNISYHQFNQSAVALASALLSKGAQRGSIIPICMNKSPNTLIAILGVLKAGAAFTPLDPRNSSERNAFIIRDVGAKLAITDSVHHNVFAGLLVHVINIDESMSKDTTPVTLGTIECTPADLAYVIYTSGSTGLPKGVKVSHAAVAASTEGMTEACNVNKEWHVLWFLNYVFDASYFDVFTVLSSGGTICVADQDTLINDLAGCINFFHVKQLMITPSISKLISPAEVPSLTTLLVCGEPITPELVSIWATKMDVYNGYGPTEATILTTVSKVLPGGNLKSIGYPLKAVKASILHKERLEPVPYGTIGELCVSGRQIAMGYLNRPDITAASFIRAQDGSVVYRTGDYARWLPNGELECLGRKDNQVKLNGFRIELGEIENCILSHAGDIIKSCVVSLATVQRKPAIVAYYVPHETSQMLQTIAKADNDDEGHLYASAIVDTSLIRERLTSLAHYMIPKVFLPLRTFPSLPSGKINRKALKAIAMRLSSGDISKYSGVLSVEISNNSDSVELSESERILRDAWAEIFEIDAHDIGASDLFSSHGGDSIGAINLVSVLRRQNWSLSVNDALSFSSLREQAQHMKGSKYSSTRDPLANFTVDPSIYRRFEAVGLKAEDIEEIYPCAPGQVEFLTQGHTEDQFWQLMTVRSVPKDFDFDRWVSLTRQLTRANQILRAMYTRQVDSDPLSWVQIILKDAVLDLDTVDCSSKEERDRLIRRHWDQHFEIGKPFVRYLVLRYEDGSMDLCTKLDHAMYDGTLLRIFDDQFAALREGNELPKAVPFKSFVAYTNQQDERARILSFWNKHLHSSGFNYPAQLENPRVGGVLVKKISLDVGSYAQSVGVTPSIVFQTAYTLFLSRLSGQTDILYDYLLTGRNVDMDDPQLINGTCANFLPFRSQFDRSSTDMPTLLRKTQNGFWKMTENGLVSLGDIYKSLGVERKKAAAKTLFLYQPFEPAQGEQDHMRWIVMAMSKVTMFVNYAIMFEVFKDVQGNKLKLQYDTRLFTKTQAEGAMESYIQIVKRMVEEGPTLAGELI